VRLIPKRCGLPARSLTSEARQDFTQPIRSVLSTANDTPMMRPILLLAVLALPLSAMASSFAGSSAGSASGASSAGSSSSGDDKIVLDARDDAAAFVASDGAIRGARLEAALLHLREQSVAQQQASDMVLARTLLAR